MPTMLVHVMTVVCACIVCVCVQNGATDCKAIRDAALERAHVSTHYKYLQLIVDFCTVVFHICMYALRDYCSVYMAVNIVN
jgi:hypothetical protein